MTTRTGEPASKRESYTQYIQGRAAAVRTSTPLYDEIERFATASSGTPFTEICKRRSHLDLSTPTHPLTFSFLS